MYSWCNFGYMKGNPNPLGCVRRIGCPIDPIEPNVLPLIRYSWHFSTSFSKLNLISCKICRLKLPYYMLFSIRVQNAATPTHKSVYMLKFMFLGHPPRNSYSTPLYGSRDQFQCWTPHRACTSVAVWVLGLHLKLRLCPKIRRPYMARDTEYITSDQVFVALLSLPSQN